MSDVRTTEDTMAFITRMGLPGFRRPEGDPSAGQSPAPVHTLAPPTGTTTEGNATNGAGADTLALIHSMGVPGFRQPAGGPPAGQSRAPVNTAGPPHAAAAEETAGSGADTMAGITQMGIPGFRVPVAGPSAGPSPAPLSTAVPPAAPVRSPISPAAAPSGSLAKAAQGVVDGISAATADLNAGRISTSVYRQKLTAFLHSGKL